MTIASGSIQYQLGIAPVTGCGFSYSEAELNTALSGPVAEVLYDDSGKANIKAMLHGLVETDFEPYGVEKIFQDSRLPENWRVGEALAKTYLVHQKNCFFPWPLRRDERKSGSSLPGADLVGFQSEGTDVFFAFGEVKTSAEKRYPPRVVMKKDDGLKQQLEDLKDKVEIRNGLIRYLAHRAVGSSWRDRFVRAVANYLKSNTDIRIFGFLVRDVKPDENDLCTCVAKLAEDQHADRVIELLALYLPQNSIGKLSDKVVSRKKG